MVGISLGQIVLQMGLASSILSAETSIQLAGTRMTSFEAE